MPKFSVLLSVYENENHEYLRQALNSIIEQSLMPDEIVIVQDGMLGGSLERVIKEFYNQYPKLVKIVGFQERRGLGPALRDGILKCSHEYIARMDTDDIAVPYRFEKQIKYLEMHPQVAVLGGWIKEFSANAAEPESLTKLPCSCEEIKVYAKRRNPFRHMTVVLKKSVVLDSGNYRDFPGFEDYDLWIRIIQKGYIVENLPEYLVNVRAGQEMFARRGGLGYLQKELDFQKLLFKSGYINCFEFAGNVTIRSFVRLVPNTLRVKIYKNFLRKEA